MDPKEACEEIQGLLKEGKTLSQIIRERPELVVGLDLLHEQLLKGNLPATVSARIKR